MALVPHVAASRAKKNQRYHNFTILNRNAAKKHQSTRDDSRRRWGSQAAGFEQRNYDSPGGRPSRPGELLLAHQNNAVQVKPKLSLLKHPEMQDQPAATTSDSPRRGTGRNAHGLLSGASSISGLPQNLRSQVNFGPGKTPDLPDHAQEPTRRRKLSSLGQKTNGAARYQGQRHAFLGEAEDPKPSRQSQENPASNEYEFNRSRYPVFEGQGGAVDHEPLRATRQAATTAKRAVVSDQHSDQSSDRSRSSPGAATKRDRKPSRSPRPLDTTKDALYALRSTMKNFKDNRQATQFQKIQTMLKEKPALAKVMNLDGFVRKVIQFKKGLDRAGNGDEQENPYINRINQQILALEEIFESSRAKSNLKASGGQESGLHVKKKPGFGARNGSKDHVISKLRSGLAQPAFLEQLKRDTKAIDVYLREDMERHEALLQKNNM